MKPVPRLLPLVGVAIGGVIAVKALAGVEAFPELLSSAKAWAEEAPTRSGRHPSPTPAAAKTASPLPAQVAAARPMAPVCAQSPSEIAKEAGLSPGELQTLQNLGARRGQLDDRERALDTQIQLLAAAEAKVDGKVKALNSLKAQIQGLLGQQDQQQQAQVDRLVTVYSKMKPRDAAAIMAALDDRVRIPVAAKMKERNLADILSQMPTLEAKKITATLARKLSSETLSQADAADPPPGLPPADAVAAKPAAQASSDTPAAKPSAPVKTAAAAPKPQHVVHKVEVRKRTAAGVRRDTPTLASARALGAAPARTVNPAIKTAASSPETAPKLASPKPVLPAPTSAATAG